MFVERDKSSRSKKGRLLVVLVGAVVLAATAVAAVEWPSDFDEKLAAHIAAETSTNTTSGVYEFSIGTCYRTCSSFGFSVMRTPPVKPGMCIVIF